MLNQKIKSVINSFRSFLKGGAKNKKTYTTQERERMLAEANTGFLILTTMEDALNA